MAFLVYFSQTPDDHARDPRDKAAYLNQSFYELIFENCRAGTGRYIVLREIASLRYKSPTLMVGRDRLDLLESELDDLGSSGASHPQIEELRHIGHMAKTKGCALTISGDMYPEL